MPIELKFRMAPEDLPAFCRHPLLERHTSTTPRARRRTVTYFDTPDLLFKCQDMALQVIATGKRCRQVLAASAGTSTDADRRREWVSDLSGQTPDCLAIAEWIRQEPELQGRALDEAVLATVKPIFTIDCSRTVWRLEYGQGQEADLALEHGEVRSDEQTKEVCELTFAHTTGTPDAFFAFALALQRDLKLHFAYRNLANIGYSLCNLLRTRAVTAKRPVLPHDSNLQQGMEIIVRNCLSQILGNATGVLKGDEPECVHQMRVGLRRLRSALDIFEPLRPCPPKIQSDLAWLAAQLGNARDWDVFNSSTMPSIAECGLDAARFAVLQKRVRQEVGKTRRRAAAAVDSLRSARLWLMLERWLNLSDRSRAKPEASGGMRCMLLRDFADLNLRRFQKKLIKRGVSMVVAEPRSRHRVRIASKKLRYATEFFFSYYRKKPAGRFIAKLADLQDIFGASNDAAVADQLLASLTQKHAGLSEICADVRAYLAGADEDRLPELKKHVRRFAALKRLVLAT